MTDKATNNFVNRKTSGMKNKIMNLISRCVLGAVKDSKKMQEVKVTILADETKDDLEHFQNYGFSSSAPKGSEGLTLSLNGNRDHTVVINIDSREFRLKGLASGEVALYSKFDSYVKLKADGSVEIKGSKIKMIGPVETSSTVVAANEITSTSAGTSLGGTKGTFNSHTHTENGTGGGTTNVPSQQI